MEDNMQTIYSKTIEKPCGFLFARWSAGAKAFETALPRERRIIDDPLAKFYAGEPGMKIVGMMQAINPSIRKAIVLRARYFDDYS
jgi:O-methyltransferase involved in polyketide biosynthesis